MKTIWLKIHLCFGSSPKVIKAFVMPGPNSVGTYHYGCVMPGPNSVGTHHIHSWDHKDKLNDILL